MHNDYLELGDDEFIIKNGERTDFYDIEDGQKKWSHCTVERGNVLVEDWPLIPEEDSKRYLATTRDVFIGEQYILSVEFSFYKGTSKEVVFQNMDQINEFLLTLEDYSDIQYIYNKVSEFLGLSNAEECAEVLISYNEKLDYVTAPMSLSIIDMDSYMSKADFYGIPREMMHYVNGKCIEFATTKYGWTGYERWDVYYLLGPFSSITFNRKEGYFATTEFGSLVDVSNSTRLDATYPVEELMSLLSVLVSKVDYTFVPEPWNLPSINYPTVRKGNLVLEDQSVENSLSWYLHIDKNYSLLVEFCFPEGTEVPCNKKEEIVEFLLCLDDYTDVKHIYNKVSGIFGLVNAADECKQVLISYNENLEHVPVPMSMPDALLHDTIMEIGFYGVPRERLHYRYGRLVDTAFSEGDWTCSGFTFDNEFVTSFLSNENYFSYNKSTDFACFTSFGYIDNLIEELAHPCKTEIAPADLNSMHQRLCQALGFDT